MKYFCPKEVQEFGEKVQMEALNMFAMMFYKLPIHFIIWSFVYFGDSPTIILFLYPFS